MSKSKPSLLSKLSSLSRARLILYSLFVILVLSYPGHNKLQTTLLNPGPLLQADLSAPELADYPASDGTPHPPVSATSFIVQDMGSKTVIAARRADVSLPPASITKLMTAMVALDAWPDQNTVLTVQNEDRAIGQTIDLMVGDQLTLDSLLHALLIHSGNDAALTIADNFDGGYSAFVQAMNDQAQKLSLTSTTFKNPSGIDQYGHTTTARDIATLASVALTHPYIRNLVTKEGELITDVTGSKTYVLESTDELLTKLPGLIGGKTGWTAGAGECFVSYVERGGRGIITVVLGSADRFGDTTRLVEWVYAHHTWIVPDVSL